MAVLFFASPFLAQTAFRSGINTPGFYLYHVEMADQSPASGSRSKNNIFA